MKFIYRAYFFILWICFVVCCKPESKTLSNSKSEQQREDSLNLKLNIMAYSKTNLDPKLDSVLVLWPVYNDLKLEIDRFDTYTIQDLISNISTVEKTVDSLHKTIPKRVDTFPVVSRINVLKSKAQHLLMLSSKQRPVLLPIKRIAEEFPLEFNGLNTQLNELFIELPDFETN